MINAILSLYKRNQRNITGNKAVKKAVNLEYWPYQKNIGDCLSQTVVDWMLNQKGNLSYKSNNCIHLLAIGSIIGMGKFNATIWGSGIHKLQSIYEIRKYRKIIKYDIRLVRGPITKQILEANGYVVPKLYGDPAVLMPLIYQKPMIEKCYDISIIPHYLHPLKANEFNVINVATDNYDVFINEILKSRKVISSSLHGIILAESYHVPAVFLNDGMDDELIKFYDYYYSTNRYNVRIAKSLEEAVKMEPMELPDFTTMRENIIKSFPYDLFKEN